MDNLHDCISWKTALLEGLSLAGFPLSSCTLHRLAHLVFPWQWRLSRVTVLSSRQKSILNHGLLGDGVCNLV